MSGHSKWHKIKHQKEATDKKKGQVFGHLAREIAVAARSEKDPAKNAALRDAIARAKKVNMPQANIDRLLSGSGKPITSTLYEGFGPAGSALLIMAETDSANRTVNEVRSILKEHGGTLGEPGTVRWKFTAQVLIEAKAQRANQLTSPAFDEVELALIDNGANDIEVEGETIFITGAPEAQAALEDTLRRFEFTIEGSNIAYVPTQPTNLEEKQKEIVTTLIEALENHSDVVEVFSDV